MNQSEAMDLGLKRLPKNLEAVCVELSPEEVTVPQKGRASATSPPHVYVYVCVCVCVWEGVDPCREWGPRSGVGVEI